MSSHPADVRAATGLVSAQVLVTATNVIGCVCMGLIIDWKIALVCLPTILILLFSVSDYQQNRWVRLTVDFYAGLAECGNAGAL